MTSTHLNGHHRKTLASIFRHPSSHNVEWHDVLSLLNNLGTASERHGGGYYIEIGADSISLGRSHGHELSGDELRQLRAFLTTAGLSAAGLTSEELEEASEDKAAGQCVVLIDHQQARLFGLGGEDADPATPRVIVPEDADGSRRRLEHKQGNDDHDGGHAAEEDAYYERISAELLAARQIVVFSDGKGRSNAGDYLIDFLKRHHPAVAERIVATDRVDIAHLSDGEIVASGLALLAAG
jgi:hypothetical protein